MAKSKKIQIFRTSKEVKSNLNDSLISLGSATGAGIGYRLAKNKIASSQKTTEKKEAVKKTITIAGVGTGAAGVIFAKNRALESASTGLFTVAVLDFIEQNFGEKVEETFGVGLGELPTQEYVQLPDITFDSRNKDIEELPPVEDFEELDDLITKNVDDFLNEPEPEQEPEQGKQVNTISEFDDSIVFDKIN